MAEIGPEDSDRGFAERRTHSVARTVVAALEIELHCCRMLVVAIPADLPWVVDSVQLSQRSRSSPDRDLSLVAKVLALMLERLGMPGQLQLGFQSRSSRLLRTVYSARSFLCLSWIPVLLYIASD